MEDRFKFRAWDKRNNKMLKVIDITFKFYDDESIGSLTLEQDNEDGYGLLCNTDNAILMQCTGLKDKNGKFIYDGDIVKINENYADWSAIDDFYRKQNFVVEYSEHQARYILKANKFKDNSGDGIYDLSPDFYEFLKWQPLGKISHGTLDFIEVLGNIYENSDLLSEVEG